MNKKIIVVGVGIIILLVSFYCIKKIRVKNIVSKCSYIGKEYCYTYDNNNEHHDERYYEFYINNKDNTIFCIENNNKIIRVNDIEDLESLYIMKINTLVIDKKNANVAFDENNNESSSYYLKNKMFPNEESNYWDFIKNEGEK